jgi:glycine betaine/choline ABC-type transport system substrate-binding protein
LLDAVSARLSSERVTELLEKVVIEGQDVTAVAKHFLRVNDLA